MNCTSSRWTSASSTCRPRWLLHGAHTACWQGDVGVATERRGNDLPVCVQNKHGTSVNQWSVGFVNEQPSRLRAGASLAVPVIATRATAATDQIHGLGRFEASTA
jgi:hypothetical protein